jgi:hypothetical protein
MDVAALLNCVQRLTALQEAIVPPGQAPRNTGVKLLPFSSADPVEWRQWRSTFTNVAANNRWDAATARTHADAMINGVAKSIIENIPLNNVVVGGVAVAPVEQLLLLFDAKFITPAAAANSRQMLFSAHQLDEESILLWHSRLYGLYKRAYPHVALADIDINIDLIEKFLKGLSDKGIGHQASTYNPDTYAAALDDAQQASKIMHGWDLPSAFCHTGGAVQSIQAPLPAIRAITTKEPFSGECHYCQIIGHRASECRRKAQDARQGLDSRPQRGRNQAQPRGRGAFCPRVGFGNNRPTGGANRGFRGGNRRNQTTPRGGGRGRGGPRRQPSGFGQNRRYQINALSQHIPIADESTPDPDSYSSAWFVDDDNDNDRWSAAGKRNGQINVT